jgi:hypothetical protein
MFQALVPTAIMAWIHFSGSWLFGDLPPVVTDVLMCIYDYHYLLSGFFVLVAFLIANLWRRGRNRALTLYKRMDGSPAAQVPILVIRRPGDEASALAARRWSRECPVDECGNHLT